MSITRESFALTRSTAWAKTVWVSPDPDVYPREPGLTEISAQVFMTSLTGTSPIVRVALQGTNKPAATDADYIELHHVDFTTDGNDWLGQGAHKTIEIKDYSYLRIRATTSSGTVVTGTITVYLQGDRVI